MKRKFKAFTLIELIIVMAIVGIMMAGLMNFFKPIRETYIDSTLYEKQRTAQNGIAEFLCESTKYADYMVIYDKGASSTYGTASSANNAVNAFKAEYYPDYSSMTADEQNALDSRIHIICINRNEEYDNTGKRKSASSADNDHLYTGRIITNVLPTDSDDASTKSAKIGVVRSSFDESGARTNSSSGYTYMALGGAYYGESDYLISVSVKNDVALNSADESSSMYESATSLTFTISNAFDNSNGVIKNGGDGVSINNDAGAVRVETENSNILKNMNRKQVNYYMLGSEPAGSISDAGVVQSPNVNTYIVYVLPEEGHR